MSAIPASFSSAANAPSSKSYAATSPIAASSPAMLPSDQKMRTLSGEVAAGAPVDLDSIEEAAEDGSAPGDVEASPMLGERSSDRKPSQAGG